MTIIVSMIVSFLIVGGISFILPQHTSFGEKKRFWKVRFGVPSMKRRGAELGLEWSFFHYGCMVTCGLGVGAILVWLTQNILLIIVGVVAGWVVPTLVMEDIIYRRKRRVLMSCVPNLRLLTSKLQEGGSLEYALDITVPLMNGATKPIFLEMLKIISIDRGEPGRALHYLKQQLTFRRIEDLCEKLLLGRNEGYSFRMVRSIAKTVDDISLDILDIQEVELVNQRKRWNMITLHLMLWTLPFLFKWMELNMADTVAMTLSMNTFLGQGLLAALSVNTLFAVLFLNRLTRFDMRDA
ncbi:hypothetical protein PQ460_10800 [Paenibacillus sp. KACC 21273]|uniref:hypothetical protein n=2 Tax=unclassified Paenibacillus TaxID=185978 RepID=UPI002365B43A|nr:hypothetical protein [Paenibacillus sp. KACC 21273]WDF52872.1 hypothetical protein PQ460_10800 [Paenibacillus sp. KACC 21273]